ncbi:MAG TPA: hypothetical protein VMV87_00700 [Burkholderiales bacterium]|nr:hypothetical protein [Burkholderiales bacterium]
MSKLMPKMRAIGVPVNDYFVENFADIPQFRYNKIPLETVTKDKDGFRLKLDVSDHPEYFIAREEVSPPNSGGNTTNVSLGLVALYSAMQVDIQFKIILPDDQSSIAQQEINDHVYNDVNIVQVHTHIWGPRECFNGNAHGRTYLLVSPHPPIDTLDAEIKTRFRRADDIPIITPGYLNSYLGPQIIVPTGIGFETIKPRVGNNDVIVCLNDDELIEKFGTQIFPDEMSNEVLLNITERFTKNHNPHMKPSMTFALGFSTGGSLTCYQYQNKQYLVHLPLDAQESTRIAETFEDAQVDPAHCGKYQVGRGDARIAGHLFYPYFIDVMKDGLSAAFAASELGAALSALMHHSKKSNITTFNQDALNKLVVRCIDKVQRNESKGENLNSAH